MKINIPTLNRHNITSTSWKFENQRFSTLKFPGKLGGNSR